MFRKPHQRSFFLTLSIIATVFGVCVTLWFVYRGIKYEKFIDYRLSLSLERSAQFGDFIGGCVGTLFALTSVFLLFETLKLQRAELQESRYIFKLQQFDSIFFNSLHLYNTILSSISDDKNTFKGRAFLDNEKARIIKNPNINSVGKSKTEYLEFYAKYETQLAHYFRTLYQIFNQIYISRIEEKDKVKYAKIIRAQLSQGELFFLYYNGRTPFGENFRKYINEYNLLKHFSVVDMPEFRNYFSKMSDLEKHSCKVIFLEISKELRDSIQNYSEWYKTYLIGKIAIKIKPQNRMCTVLNFDLIFSPKAQIKDLAYQQGFGLQNLTQQDLVRLFTSYLEHAIGSSNYYQKNESRIRIKSTETISQGVITNHFIITRLDNKGIKC